MWKVTLFPLVALLSIAHGRRWRNVTLHSYLANTFCSRLPPPVKPKARCRHVGSNALEDNAEWATKRNMWRSLLRNAERGDEGVSCRRKCRFPESAVHFFCMQGDLQKRNCVQSLNGYLFQTTGVEEEKIRCRTINCNGGIPYRDPNSCCQRCRKCYDG